MLSERSGEALTFSRLAEVAQVSRRTLYTHWGSIERVIGEAIALHTAEHEVDPEGLTPRQILTELLKGARARLVDPITHVAITTLIAQGAQDDKAAETLAALGTARLDEYAELLGPITHEQYSQIVGPLFFSQLVLGEELTDEFLEQLVDRGVTLLGLDPA